MTTNTQPSLSKTLEEYKTQLGEDEILAVECRTSAQRRWLHIWATRNGLDSKACRYYRFEDNTMLQCNKCFFRTYKENLNWFHEHWDWPDMFGRCPHCRNNIYYIYYNRWTLKPCPDNVNGAKWSTIYDTYNGVAIGTNLPAKHQDLDFGRFTKRKLFPEDAKLSDQEIHDALDRHIEDWKIDKLNTYRFSFYCL